MCFQHCADNLFNRDLSTDEANCLDKCVKKFSNVNQRVMGAYIAEQTVINERRTKEVEAQLAAVAANEVTPTVSSANNSESISDTVSLNALPNESTTTTNTVESLTSEQHQIAT